MAKDKKETNLFNRLFDPKPPIFADAQEPDFQEKASAIFERVNDQLAWNKHATDVNTSLSKQYKQENASRKGGQQSTILPEVWVEAEHIRDAYIKVHGRQPRDKSHISRHIQKQLLKQLEAQQVPSLESLRKRLLS